VIGGLSWKIGTVAWGLPPIEGRVFWEKVGRWAEFAAGVGGGFGDDWKGFDDIE